MKSATIEKMTIPECHTERLFMMSSSDLKNA